jgi:fumarate reductase subunit C
VGLEVSDVEQQSSGRVGPYRRSMSPWWWLENRAYFKFIVRELTCLFVGIFALLSLWQVRALKAGPDAYAAFMDRLATPGFALLNGAVLLFVLYHAVTFLNIVPTIMVIRVGDWRVPDRVIAGAHYALWAVLSATVAGILLTR